jgi:hypothetical protein
MKPLSAVTLEGQVADVYQPALEDLCKSKEESVESH